jgi:hypothetical protein
VNADWFYSVGDTRQGPVTEDDIKRLVADGRLKPSDLVWRDGMPDWVEARTVPVLFPSPRGEPLPDEDRPTRRRHGDDRPRRRGRRDDDDEAEDDRPRIRRRDDDYDQYEDEYDRPKKPAKPGQVQAVAIMMLVGGILGILTALAVAAASICLWPGVYYELVVAILFIIRGTNMLNQDDRGPPRTLAILQIICIVNGDIPNCVRGIVSVIMLNDPKVEEYYRRRGF